MITEGSNSAALSFAFVARISGSICNLAYDVNGARIPGFNVDIEDKHK